MKRIMVFLGFLSKTVLLADNRILFLNQNLSPVNVTHRCLVTLGGILVERLWRRAEYEEVDINDYDTVMDAVFKMNHLISRWTTRHRLRSILERR